MKTPTEFLKEKGVFLTDFISSSSYEAVAEVLKSYASEACREQREICAEHAEVYYPASNNLNPTIDPKSIKNAPEPTLS